MIYVDVGHSSTAFTTSLTAELEQFIRAALAGTGGHFGDAGDG